MYFVVLFLVGSKFTLQLAVDFAHLHPSQQSPPAHVAI